MTDSNGSKKRVTVKRPHPNPQIHEFLMSLREEAVRVNSSLLPNLEQAIHSFAKYPLPLTSAADCAILKGFNKRLCNLIEIRLNGANKKYKTHKGEESKNKKNNNCNNGESSNKYIESSFYVNSNYIDTNMATSSNKTKTKKSNSVEIDNNNLKLNVDFSPIAAKPDKQVKNKGKAKNTKNYNSNKAKKIDHPDINLENKNEKALHVSCDSPVSLGFNDPSDLLGKWDLIPNSNSPKRKPTKYCSVDLTTFRPIEDNTQRADQSEIKPTINDFPLHNKNPVINLVDDVEEYIDQYQYEMKSIEPNENEEIQNYSHPNYADTASNCLECSNIELAANAFEISFKEKLKKDTEEIRKCVLPRKLYLPDYKTPSYALVVALYEQRKECPYREALTKEELVQKAQKHSDQLLTRPESGPVSKLVMKGMIEVENVGGEDYYKLTTMGRAVALELVREDSYNNEKAVTSDWPSDRVPVLQNVVRAPAPVPPDEGENPEPVFIEMPPGTFEIILLIDTRENFKPNNLHKCKYELRSLTVGDFLWIARSKKTGQELVLPYIIERKRMDDLASSIKDGRFHEQKFRLRKSGLENVIYLIENHGRNKNLGLPLPTLKQAMVNTGVQDNFMVVNTESLVHTFKLLAKMSERLVHDFSPKHLRGCNRDTQGKELSTFEFFNKTSCKNKPLTVKDTFIKMLVQLKGLSVEKALAITNKYETPMALMKAYDKCSAKEGEALLAGLKFNNFSRNVGPAVSKTIYQLFSKRQL